MDVHLGTRRYRIHARRSYYGRPRYDFVEIIAPEGSDVEHWYAQVLLLFDVYAVGNATVRQMALIFWLERSDRADVPRSITLVHWGNKTDCIDVESIRRPVRLATSPIAEGNGNRRFLLLDYGRANR